MKNLIILLLILTIAACKKADPCETAICYNGGTCVNGACNCPPGYSGAHCENTIVYGCTDPSASNYNPSATVDNGNCQYTGSVVFWYNSAGTNATVYINGQTGLVTSYYSGFDPTCGSSGCANFTLNTGTYSWSASSTFSNWSGTVTVYKNGCSKVLLN